MRPKYGLTSEAKFKAAGSFVPSKKASSNSKTLSTCKAPNTTIAEFANTVDPDETAAHNEPSHLNLQCLPSGQHYTVYIERFLKICRHNSVICRGKCFI